MNPQLTLSSEQFGLLREGRYAIEPCAFKHDGDTPRWVDDPVRARIFGAVEAGECLDCGLTHRHLVPLAAVPIPCPTCEGSGDGWKDYWSQDSEPCPDCSDGYWRGPVDLVVEEHWHCPCSCHGSRGMTVKHVAPCCNLRDGWRRVGGAVIENVLAVFPDEMGMCPVTEDHVCRRSLRGGPALWLYLDESTDVSHLSEFFPPGIEWAYILKDVI